MSNKDLKAKTYTLTALCQNCGFEEKVEIPLGTTANDFCRLCKCSQCQCVRTGITKFRI